MLLGVRPLINVVNVNAYDVSTQVQFSEGDTVLVYFQLIDLQKDLQANPPGKRYMPVTGATLTVSITNVNDAFTVSKTAVQPFANDTSIWQFQILPADALSGTYTFTVVLNEASVITYGRAPNSLMVRPLSGVAVYPLP